jgi:hypothetical protein
MLEEKNKLNEKFEMAVKEKLELEGKVAKLTAQLTDTIKNSNEMSSKHVCLKILLNFLLY